jgi:hypothetical protein
MPKTLDGMLEIKDQGSFGKKAEGLVRLRRFLDKWKPGKEMPRCFIPTIPQLFGLEADERLGSIEVEEHYRWLTGNLTDRRIILARSSDPDEMPGKFETHYSLFDPADRDGSFQNWLRAANRVRDSGARALLGQGLVGRLEKFDYDVHYSEGKRPEKVTSSVEAFGAGNSSFFGQSRGFTDGVSPELSACGGLATKLARGDMDISLITAHRDWGSELISNLNNDYATIASSGEAYKQESIDLLTLESPESIRTIDIDSGVRKVFTYFAGRNYNVAFDCEYEFSNFEYFRLSYIFELLCALESKLGSPVEVEGCVNDQGIHLWQLRDYELPVRGLGKLTKISPEKSILTATLGAIGFSRFSGDMVISGILSDFEPDSISVYTGHISDEDIPRLAGYPKLIFTVPELGRINHTGHFFGYAAQMIVKLRKLGVEAIAIDDETLEKLRYAKLSKEEEMTSSPSRRINDVTVECVDRYLQVYQNS